MTEWIVVPSLLALAIVCTAYCRERRIMVRRVREATKGE